MSELLGFLKAQKSSRGARMVLSTLDNKDLENGDGRCDDEKASCSYIKTINGMKVNDHETCYDTSDSGSAGLIEHNTLENESNEFLESDCSVRDPDYEPSSSSKNGNSDQENYDLADERNITELDIEVLERKERTRWRRSNPSGWKKNKVKKMKIEQRQPKQVNCSRCRFTCSKKISEETRRRICTVFWNCDFKRQKDFILNYVESTPPVRRRIRNENGTVRRDAKKYFLEDQSIKYRVCKLFFLKSMHLHIKVMEEYSKAKIHVVERRQVTKHVRKMCK
nr:unnamed protein product [Callosobruchus chinensis]